MSDICVFRKERNGRFINCIALKTGDCLVKCIFGKTEDEYQQGIFNVKNSLGRMGLNVTVKKMEN